MQLYIIRHCQSANNALWSETGSDAGRDPDPVLTATGHEQAKKLASFICRGAAGETHSTYDAYERGGITLDYLYCSLMRRAVITGEYIARATGLPLIGWKDIHERGGIYHRDELTGEPAGLPGADAAYFASHHPGLILPEGVNGGWWNRSREEPDEAVARAHEALRQLLARHGGSDARVGWISHAGFFQSILQALFGANQVTDAFGEPRKLFVRINNASVSRIDFDDNYIVLSYTNRIDFLPPELVT
jgi:2,3-bisphosphoglycerate-dependent phosphoglycerate mutase